jgi:hypothetical protein
MRLLRVENGARTTVFSVSFCLLSLWRRHAHRFKNPMANPQHNLPSLPFLNILFYTPGTTSFIRPLFVRTCKLFKLYTLNGVLRGITIHDGTQFSHASPYSSRSIPPNPQHTHIAEISQIHSSFSNNRRSLGSNSHRVNPDVRCV